ncbi:hypothetical protein BA177_04435 [Woeseia oceani]|uniref:Beta-lactamase-related domain-containing protein n=1 Tax=Woeseia oceani TaxID=1548547 RepID=A0A193LDV4_9GAMM|nr:hypothetical protein BA177_04435 [Woeseia oceani]
MAFSQTEAEERIRAALPESIDDSFPGCAVGVFSNGKVVTSDFVGLADVAGKRPINADTQFYAASVSKQFTAVAVMQLVIQGKLKLSDDIRKYLPEMPQYQRPVTVQMLLNHTSGIRDSLNLLRAAGYDYASRSSRSHALQLTMDQEQTNFDPGTRYAYSNGGYLLLAEIVARVAEQPFGEYVEQYVLAPTGMTRSFVLDGSPAADPNLALGYVVKDGKIKQSNEYPLFGGSGGLITTVNDLAKWDYDLDQGQKVWTPELLRLMTQLSTFNSGVKVASPNGIYYANGLLVGPHWIGHSGGASGFKTYYARHSESRIGIAMLCNRGEINPLYHVDQIILALEKGLPPASERSVEAAAINGRYRSESLNVTYLVEMNSDGNLNLSILAPDESIRETMTLEPTDAGSYKSSGMEITPDSDGRGFSLKMSRFSLSFGRVS